MIPRLEFAVGDIGLILFQFFTQRVGATRLGKKLIDELERSSRGLYCTEIVDLGQSPDDHTRSSYSVSARHSDQATDDLH